MSSRKAAMATKKILYGLLGLVVVGSIAYSASQGGNLLGLFSTGSDLDLGDLMDTNAEKASTASDNTKASRDEAESYASAAETAADKVATAYEEEDADALDTAQASATEAADNAQNSANEAQSYADEAQGYYEEAYEAQNTVYEEVQTVSANVTSSFAAYTAAQETVETAEQAVSDAETAIEDANKSLAACDGGDPSYSGSCYRMASEKLDEAEAALETAQKELAQANISLAIKEEEYNNYVTEYTEVYTKFSDKKDISDAAEAYATTAAGYATEAATFASEAADAEEAAYNYNFLSCQSLSISPDSYEMAASDTEASFDLTVNITGQELVDPSSVDTGSVLRGLGDNLLKLTPSWLQTFVLSDFGGSSGSGSKWLGTLVFETDGSGTFAYEANEANPLSVTTNSEEEIIVSFSGGIAGDTLSVYADGEEEACSEEFTLTQADSTDDTETDTTDTTDTTSDDDDDGDGLTVSEEEELGTTDTDADTDNDGLTDGEEVLTYDTDPLDDDSDSDGLSDGEEVETYDTDPLDDDSDDDGLSDGEEVLTYDTDPNDEDSDGDGVDDGDEIDDDTDPNDADDGGDNEVTVDDDDDDNAVTVDEDERKLALESADYSCDDPFTDTRDEWYEEIVCRMYNAEVVEGESSTKFVPGDDVTRAEAIKMIVGLLLEETESDAYGLTSGFSDVSKSDWYYPWLNLAEEADIIRTRDAGATFNPNTPITRGDLALYIARALDLSSYDYEIQYDDRTGDEYFAYAVAILSEATTDVPYDDSDEEVAVLEGYSSGYFKPYVYINRAEALTMIYRAYLAYLAE